MDGTDVIHRHYISLPLSARLAHLWGWRCGCCWARWQGGRAGRGRRRAGGARFRAAQPRRRGCDRASYSSVSAWHSFLVGTTAGALPLITTMPTHSPLLILPFSLPSCHIVTLYTTATTVCAATSPQPHPQPARQQRFTVAWYPSSARLPPPALRARMPATRPWAGVWHVAT